MPTPREAYIDESIASFKQLWLREPLIHVNPIAEGVRLATLVYKHASRMQADREFFIKAYFPACFMICNIDGKADRFWSKKENVNDNHRQAFLNSAALAFHELAKQDGYYDEGMSVFTVG